MVEGEPAIADRQPFVSGVFGDIFDVLTAADVQSSRSKTQTLLPSYRAVVAGGRIDWSAEWIQRINDYVRNGGTLVASGRVRLAPDAGFPGAFRIHISTPRVKM